MSICILNIKILENCILANCESFLLLVVAVGLITVICPVYKCIFLCARHLY